MLPLDATPDRFADLPVTSIGVGIVDCGVSLSIPPDDQDLPAEAFAFRYLGPAEFVLADHIERRGRHRFVGVAFTLTLRDGAPLLMISALRKP